jgi:hypothetical protein
LSSYDYYSEIIKIQIPNLIVDVIAVMFFKSDPYGKKIFTFQIKPYYISKKELLMNNDFLYPINVTENNSYDVSSLKKGMNAQIQDNAEKIIKIQKINKLNSNPNDVILDDTKLAADDDVICRISHITRRDGDSIRQSLSALPQKEINKLYDICNKYNKIVEYGKLGNLKDFKLAIEVDLKRSLSDRQARHSQMSIKKAQYYIENVLDRKFEPHFTHGINHIKHNFEYGYRLVGLISNPKFI